ARSPPSRENENQGRNYETQHFAELQQICMDGVVLCNSHGHPPYLNACVPVVRSVSSCLMSTFQNLRHLGRRLPLLGFCFLLALPTLSAQAGRDLIKDACYNE